MKSWIGNIFAGAAGAACLALATLTPVTAARAESASAVEHTFDEVLGTQYREPQDLDPSSFQARLAALANASRGRIGVAAMDLETGETVQVLGNQRFPMASTSKIAIAATFMEGVEKGRWSLTSEFPMMVPVRSAPHSSAVAPVRPGKYYQAVDLIEMMITRSNNEAADALLAAVGGPPAVNRWMRRAGITDFRIDHDIATLVRDDGAVNPATTIDPHDSATPLAMIQLLQGLYDGRWLSASSRNVILGAMERCRTGKRRIRALLPEDAVVAHKTGSLFNTSSDIGIVRSPQGHAIAVAIYVTGQGTRLAREGRIATLARAIYDEYNTTGGPFERTASR